MFKNYYAILGVSPEASEEEVKAAFERLKVNQPQTGSAWPEVEEAYEVLSDPQARQEYHRLYKIFDKANDRFDGFDWSQTGEMGFRGLPRAPKTTAVPLEETFDLEWELDNLDEEAVRNLLQSLQATIAGWFQGKDAVSTSESKDKNIYLDLSLKPEARTHGSYHALDYHCYIVCSDCQGSGSYRGRPLAKCPVCFKRSKKDCAVCAGVGQYPEENCPKCKGEGRVMARRQVEVKVPKKIEHNSIIQVKGAGHRGFRGLPNGDLFVKILVQE